MKATTIALFAAVLITAAPAALAQNVSTKTPHHHKVFKKHPQVVTGYAPWQVMHATNGARTGYPGASRYAPSAPEGYTNDASKNAGGGAGGGGGGGSGM